MRALLYTPGSPFARGVRVLLDELGLPYERRETGGAASIHNHEISPTLQVPTLWDNGRVLWESGLIADYLLTRYRRRIEANRHLADHLARPQCIWDDRVLFATIQTLGTAATTISQLTWTGVSITENDHLARCATRISTTLDWLEMQLASSKFGFFGERVSAQDVFLACHLGFIANRPLGIDPALSRRSRISSLVERMNVRASFRANPILWWEPGVIGYADDGCTPIYAQ